MVKLAAIPITQKHAKTFVAQHHRHHQLPLGSIFQVAVARDGDVVGVAMVGRPVSRMVDTGRIVEVARLCTLESLDARHAASKLSAICLRISREMGYERMITYTLASEHGISLRAAGWYPTHQNRGGSWSSPSRPRTDRHPTGSKIRWELAT